MARDVDGLEGLLADGFTRELLVSVLHGTDPVGSAAVESWSLDGDLGRDPKTTGKLRLVHSSIKGESWVPRGTSGILSPYRATLLLTEVISAGTYRRVVQLGMFDVVAIPFAQDTTATVGARWLETTDTIGDTVPLDVPLEVPGETVYLYGELVGGSEQIVASIIDGEVESLDGRVLTASLRSPRTSGQSAWDEWRAVGLLPVQQSGADVTIPVTTWPAEDGSRLDVVQHSARALGGVPVVNSYGQWVLADANTPVVELHLGEHGTVVEVASTLSLDGFANVIIGNYEDDLGNALRSEWVAPGSLSPAVMGREIVRHVTSNLVRTQEAADAHVAEQGTLATTREVDFDVACVYNPILELGDHVAVPGTDVSGIAVKLTASNDPTMRVTVRGRRPL